MNAIQTRNVTGWAGYLTRRALAVGLVGIVMVGAGAILAGALLLTGIVEIPTAQNTPQRAIEAVNVESYPAAQIGAHSPAQSTAQDGLGEAIGGAEGDSITAATQGRAEGRAIGYTTADEAAGNCAPGETVIKNFRGGYSCNIER